MVPLGNVDSEAYPYYIASIYAFVDLDSVRNKPDIWPVFPSPLPAEAYRPFSTTIFHPPVDFVFAHLLTYQKKHN